MRAAWLIYGTLGWWSGTGSILAGLSPQQLAQLPPPATITVQFQRDVQALLEARCVQCHGRGKASGKFSLESRETTLAGGSSGPAVVPGRSAESYLIELVSGVDPDNVMPAKGTRLTPEEVGLLRAWIDQGLSWEPAINFARPAARNLSPRRPELPASASNSASSSSQPVDRFVQSYFDQAGVTMPGAVDDRLFVRRVFLDVIGLIPAPEDMAAFEADSAPDKRARLVRRLLADEEDYAVHWLTFWNDALRNDYQGTGYIDGGRRQITGWLYRALAENRPFDQFVRELVNPEPDAAGFVNGIIWRGVVNASQTPEMQAAQNVSQVFMGVNLKCASCHDSFINDWTLADAYGLAGVYAQEPLEMVHCDKPTGEVAPLRFLYPELGEIQPQLSREERLRQLADLMTGERNGRLSRTIVNRIWARLMGRGLVEPLDDMEQAAWHPELLDWLAADLVDHGYDLKRTLELILTSQAYQLPSVPAAENTKADFAFRGPTIRRLTAEQFLDAVSRITGVWNMLPTARANFQATDSPTEPPTATAGWIWTNPGAGTSAPPQTVRWRRDFQLATAPDAAIAVVACDNEFRLFVNGQPVGSGKDFSRPQLIDLSSVLERGRNVIAIETVNAPANPDKPELDQSSPAGLLAQVSVRSGAKPESPEPRFFRIGTDQSWRWTLEETEGWTEPGFDDSTWNAAVELGSPESGPWNLGEPWRATVSIETWVGRARAALMANDPLMTALGRPNREQVVTSRPTAATTLQALELTNGETLAQALRRGVARLLEDGPASVDQSVVVLYQRALGRPPTLEESRLARVVLGSGQEPAGLEDMLWAMIMLPEFQLIH